MGFSSIPGLLGVYSLEYVHYNYSNILYILLKSIYVYYVQLFCM